MRKKRKGKEKKEKGKARCRRHHNHYSACLPSVSDPEAWEEEAWALWGCRAPEGGSALVHGRYPHAQPRG